MQREESAELADRDKLPTKERWKTQQGLENIIGKVAVAEEGKEHEHFKARHKWIPSEEIHRLEEHSVRVAWPDGSAVKPQERARECFEPADRQQLEHKILVNKQDKSYNLVP